MVSPKGALAVKIQTPPPQCVKRECQHFLKLLYNFLLYIFPQSHPPGAATVSYINIFICYI